MPEDSSRVVCLRLEIRSDWTSSGFISDKSCLCATELIAMYQQRSSSSNLLDTRISSIVTP